MPFNKNQIIAAQTYAGGDFAHCENFAEVEQVGDTLFRFIMIELADSEGCDSLDEGVRRMRVAVDDLQEVYERIEKASLEVE